MANCRWQKSNGGFRVRKRLLSVHPCVCLIDRKWPNPVRYRTWAVDPREAVGYAWLASPSAPCESIVCSEAARFPRAKVRVKQLTRSGYDRRSFVEKRMYQSKTLTGNLLRARRIGSQRPIAIRVGLVNHMALTRPQSVRIA